MCYNIQTCPQHTICGLKTSNNGSFIRLFASVSCFPFFTSIKFILFTPICLFCIINGLSCQNCKDHLPMSRCNVGNVVPISDGDMHDTALRTTLPKILGVVIRQQHCDCNSNMASLGRRRGVPVSRERSVTSHPVY